MAMKENVVVLGTIAQFLCRKKSSFWPREATQRQDEIKFTLSKKCLYSELFWSAFSRIGTEYGGMLSSLCIQSECRNIRTSITPNKGAFYAVSSLGIIEVDFLSYGMKITFVHNKGV